MSRRLALAVLLFIPSVATSAAGTAQWVTYDDFGGPLIDPGRWFASQATSGPPSATTEMGRLITAGVLRMLVAQHGNENLDTGTVTGASRLNVTDPGSVLGMRAWVAVIRAAAQGCAQSTATTRARAQLQGGWFNDGSGGGAGDRTGDIIAGVQKIADSTLGNVIQAYIVRCTNPACSAQAPVLNDVFNTTWSINRPHRLSIEHDATNERFVYAVRPLIGPEETLELSYAGVLSDAVPPAVNFRHLAINNSAANCTGGQRQSVMDALFESFQVLRP